MADVRVQFPAVERGDEVVTFEAVTLVGRLQARSGARRDALPAAGATRRAELAAARRIDVRPETRGIPDDLTVPAYGLGE